MFANFNPAWVPAILVVLGTVMAFNSRSYKLIMIVYAAFLVYVLSLTFQGLTTINTTVADHADQYMIYSAMITGSGLIIALAFYLSKVEKRQKEKSQESIKPKKAKRTKSSKKSSHEETLEGFMKDFNKKSKL